MRKLISILFALSFFVQSAFAVSYGVGLGAGEPGAIPYDSTAVFPLLAADGAVAVDKATDTLYVFDGGTGSWVAAGGGGGGGGTVLSVGGTAPISSTGGANPVLSCAVASGVLAGCLAPADFMAFNAKEPAVAAATTSDYYRGDKTFQTLDTLAVGENTNLYFTNARAIAAVITGYSSGAGTVAATDTVLQAIQKLDGNIATKEPAITAGTTLQYWRGDKSFQTLDTSVVPENTNLYYTQGRFDTAFDAKTTTDLDEGSNLYYTDGRFDTRLGTKSTTDLAEGTNLYYTAARFNTAFGGKSTTDLAEGTNLYFTDSRATSAPLTGFTSGAGTVTGADSVLSAIQKLDGNATDGLATKWSKTGDAGTNPTTDFVGTSDAQDLSIRRNSVEKLLVGSAVTASSNVLQAPDGTASLPGLRLASDNDTGLFQTGDGNLSIAANGAQKVSVDQNSTTFSTETIAPSVTTPLVGTTSAADLVLRANSTNVLSVTSAHPGLSSSVTQAPADGVGINQFDFRVFSSPSASTTNASQTGMFSQLVYDNPNAGFDSTGGAYLANSANFTNNGSGTLGFASIYSGGASFTNNGTTSQFKGVTSESTISSGATVTDYVGMVSGLNTTGGIVPASNSLSLYGNFTDATIGNAFGINQALSFSGTTANSQGVTGVNSFIQFNDSTTTTNGTNGVSLGIDLNDTAALTGLNGSNVFINVRDSSTHGGLNLYNAGLNQEGSSVNPNGVTSFNSNLQFSDTSDTGGVSIFNAYARTSDTAHLDSLTVLNMNPEIEGTSDVDNITLGSFTGQIRGSSTVDNLTGVNINPQMSGSAAVTNFTGLFVSPQLSGTPTLTNGLTAIQVSPSSSIDLAGANGVTIDMSGVSLTPGALAAGGQKTGLSINDGALSAGYNYTVPGAAGFFQTNYLGGTATVASGDPTSSFGFGNNFAHTVRLMDNWGIDPSGLGFVDVGFVGSLHFDAGLTMASWTGALGGAGNPAGAGTLTNAYMFRSAGILPQGGSLTVTNAYGFYVDPNLSCLTGTNCWGFYEDTAAAENHLSKLAIGTSTKKVANSDTALEIGNNKAFINGRGTTAQKNALAAVAGMQFYDTTLSELHWYDGASWIPAMGGAGAVTSVNTQTGAVVLDTDDIAEGATNLYYTDARAIAAPLTGYTSGAGTVAATDSVIQAIQKLNGNDAAFELLSNKATDFSTLNNTLYPTVQAVQTQILSAMSGLTAYFSYNTASDIATYLKALPTASVGALQTITTAGVTNGQLLATFATDPGSPNITFLPSGIVKFHIHGTKTAGTRVAQLSFTLSKRTNPGGVETLICTSSNSVVITGVDAELSSDCAIASPVTMLASDRLVQKVFGVITGGGSAPTIQLDLEGSTAARFEVPTSSFTAGINQLTGDVTAGPGSGSQAATIANLAVTNAKIANSTIDLTTKVTGVLPAANGGFGTEAQEVPAGTINNSNVTFTLANTPVANANVKLYQSGLILVQGTDYTLSGVTITMTTAPNFGQTLYADYRH